MKFYRKITRFQFRRLVSRPMYRHLEWAASLKPGDLVYACTGFNVRIASIQPIRNSAAQWFGKNHHGSSHRNGWFVHEFEITDTKGLCHHTGTCVWKKRTREEVEAWWLEFATEREAEEFKALRAHILKTLCSGGHVCDEDGVVLPEFERSSDNTTEPV